MSKNRLVSAVVASLLLTSAAFAALTTESGLIKSLDVTKHQIVLDSGKTFDAPAIELKTFKVGDRVTISFEMKDGKMVADKVEAAK